MTDRERGSGNTRVVNVTRGAVLAGRSGKATNPLTRAIGLMGRKSLPEGGGLVIQPCNGVVCFFMRFPIDVLFVDADGRIVHLIERMAPWTVSRIVRASKLVVELPAGTIEGTGTEIGDTVEISST